MADAHVPRHRLHEDLDPDEAAHLAGCVRCRVERMRVDAGERKLGRYDVVGRVGAGGMARVFAVVDPATGERRAAKRVLVPSPSARARFAREARLQARVDHPNVLPVLEVLEVAGHLVLVMPLVDGPTLQRLLAVDRPPLDQRLALFRQIVDGVAAVHRAGLVHRDLKPGNVLLEPTATGVTARVADFGLVKGPDDSALTHSGLVVGTPGYMAPEQREDPSAVDARADVWALGAILRELLGGLPAGPWGDLVRTLGAADPADRPPDAGAVAERLPPTDPVDPALADRCRALAPVPTPGEATFAPTDDAPGQVRTTLPAERDAFVGRESELAALAGVLAGGARLVSVLGLGGTGKTRLVVHYGWLWLDDWPGGVWFCDLADARTVDGIVAAVARSLDLPLGNDPVAQLGHALAGRRRCLVVLDNFEQVVRHAADTVGRWLDRASEARFVVTSRAVLGLPGETALAVAPLEPDEGLALFVARATQARREFALSEADRPQALTLVRLLDGLPLAIELAAARVRVMTVPALVARMSERFRLLAGSGDRVGRHATLRAALDWSWDLLHPDEQAGLAQLSVFDGGFDLEAAEAVLSVGDRWPADVVQALVDQSLVRARPDGRFELLVSVRAYGAERLAARPGDGAAQRHGQWFARYGDASLASAVAAVPVAEFDNVAAACRSAIDRGDGDVAVRTLFAAWELIELAGPLGVGVALAEAVVGMVGVHPTGGPGPALAARVLGDALHYVGRTEEAGEAYTHALALCRTAGDALGEATTIGRLGLLARQLGRPDEARARYDAALALHRAIDNRAGQADTLGNLGVLERQLGRTAAARACYEAALAVDDPGRPRTRAVLRGNLGVLAMFEGRADEAFGHYTEALAVHRDMGDVRLEGVVLVNLAVLAYDVGRPEDAVVHARAALGLHRHVGNRRFEGIALGTVGTALLAAGRREEARGSLGPALAIHRELGNKRHEGIVLADLAEIDLDEGHLADARTRLTLAEGLAKAVSDRRAEARTVALRARLDAAEGRLEAATALLDHADAVVRDLGSGATGTALAAVRAEIRWRSGDADGARAALAELEGRPRDAAARRELARVSSLVTA